MYTPEDDDIYMGDGFPSLKTLIKQACSKNETISILTNRIFDLNKSMAKLEKINQEQSEEILRLKNETSDHPIISKIECKASKCYKPLICNKNGYCCAIDDIPF
jgi:hypothetical protein